MKYEEALGAVTSLCENWKTTRSNYMLEEAAFKTDVNALHERVQTLLDNVFSALSEGNVKVERSHVTSIVNHRPTSINSNSFDVKFFGEEQKVSAYLCPVYWENIEGDGKQIFADNLIKFLIARASVYAETRIRKVNLQMMSKLYSYLKLIELDVKEGSLYENLLTEIAKEREIVDRHAEVVDAYRNWCDEVAEAIKNAGNAWFEQSCEFVPEMQVVIMDLRNRERTTKTVRSTSKRSAEPIVRFTDGSYVYKDNGRIDAIGTWLLQHEEFKEVVDTCELYFR